MLLRWIAFALLIACSGHAAPPAAYPGWDTRLLTYLQGSGVRDSKLMYPPPLHQQADVYSITDTTARPWRYIGLVRAIKDRTNQQYSSCTGTLITRHVVMTAAHCVYDEQGGYYQDIRFTPGALPDKPTGKSFTGDEAIVPRALARNFDNNHDIAFIHLKHSPLADTAATTDTVLPLSVVDRSHFENSTPTLTLLAVGYPNTGGSLDTTPNLITAFTQTYRNTRLIGKGNQFEHRAFTGEGSSGGPVFAWHPAYQQLAIVGVISSERTWADGEQWAVAVMLDVQAYRYMRQALKRFEPDYRPAD